VLTPRFGSVVLLKQQNIIKELTEMLDLMRSGKRFQERMVADKK
jgi:hypothetical protein